MPSSCIEPCWAVLLSAIRRCFAVGGQRGHRRSCARALRGHEGQLHAGSVPTRLWAEQGSARGAALNPMWTTAPRRALPAPLKWSGKGRLGLPPPPRLHPGGPCPRCPTRHVRSPDPDARAGPGGHQGARRLRERRGAAGPAGREGAAGGAGPGRWVRNMGVLGFLPSPAWRDEGWEESGEREQPECIPRRSARGKGVVEAEGRCWYKDK